MDNTDMNANFCFPIPQQLQNACVKLVPFNTVLRAPAFCAAANDDAHTYLPWGPFSTPANFVSTVIEQCTAPDLFAVLDLESTSAPDGEGEGDAGTLVGTIGNTSASHLSTEFGFTPSRASSARTTSNAARLLLHCLLDTVRGGLRQRRERTERERGGRGAHAVPRGEAAALGPGVAGVEGGGDGRERGCDQGGQSAGGVFWWR
ncbi:hypothetical protein B0H11DRAFT_447876 [Mycena galericulata]|nr:hypothetical protein B0H11DRAFT_447876 [Mycena galericulata]